MRALRYSFHEAVGSLWRGRQSALLSTSTIALALLVLGGFLIATANLQRLGAEWSSAAEMSVYLEDQITDQQRTAIEGALAPSDIVASREYVSKSTALSRFRETFSDLAGSIETLGTNPLPASYEVRLKAGPASEAGVEALGARLRATSCIESPPVFSSSASASTNASIASPMTPAAGTDVTSERSYCARCGSRESMSTEGRPSRSVEIGFW